MPSYGQSFGAHRKRGPRLIESPMQDKGNDSPLARRGPARIVTAPGE